MDQDSMHVLKDLAEFCEGIPLSRENCTSRGGSNILLDQDQLGSGYWP
jgi:hypothetical protein